MPHPHRAVQVGGAWFAIASVLMIAALGLHGPIAPDLQDQMTRIADAAGRWSVAHWIAAASLSLYAVSGLIMLTSGSGLTERGETLTAWAVICVAPLWTMTTAIAESTVVTQAAVSGNYETFAAWWGFAEGKANGFAFVALAVAAIAGTDARAPARVTPAWSAWIAVVAGLASFTGWALGMWLGVAMGSHLWVGSSILMSLWTAWFGVTLLHSPPAAAISDHPAAVPASPPSTSTPPGKSFTHT